MFLKGGVYAWESGVWWAVKVLHLRGSISRLQIAAVYILMLETKRKGGRGRLCSNLGGAGEGL